MSRINQIVLNNFKFFYGQKEIPVEGKNLLIYGENGSGKSSIYWALYTFLQSSFKTPPGVVKYFDTKSSENLRNRFIDDKESSSISLVFDDGVPRTISEKGINTKTEETDNFVLEATLGSDFINHHTLSRIYAYYHKEEINLFDIFEHELLAFITFDKPSLVKQGETEANSSAEVWWNYISDFIPKISGKDLIIEFLKDFNQNFATYLNTISERTNNYITDRFKEKFNIQFEYRPASYPLPEEGEDVILNQKVKKPEIIMTVKMLTDKIADNNKKIIDSPQSFLNEAKLSTISLALRLAMLDEKYVQGYPKVLILDDMLMSMDMSNREFILGILFENYLPDYQIIFLTHQRGLFEDARIYIENYYAEKTRLAGEQNREIQKNTWKDYWKLFEMYEAENGNGIPIPHIVDYESSIQKAIKYFKYQVDYNACGNNLRVALEEFFLDFIPHNFQKNGNMIAGILVDAKTYFSHVGFDTTLLDKLERYRERSLNPSSHYNPKTDYFKRELEDIFGILQKLKSNRNDALISKDNKIKFEINTQSGKTFSYTAILLDDICLYQKYDKTPSYFNSSDERGYVMIECVEGGTTSKLNHTINKSTLQKLYDDTVAFINILEVAIIEPDMYEVFKDEFGTKLNDLKKY